MSLKQLVKNTTKRIIPADYQPVLKKNILRLIYWGSTFHCPVCQSGVRAMKPLGYNLPVILEKQIVGSGLRNALCPVCGSSDRVRLLYLFLKSKTNLFTKSVKLLHIAPEKPLLDIFINQKNIDYLTADLNMEQAMVKMDITAIQFPDNTFDAILCNHVLEHIPDDRKAMNELYRVLKPNGWAILQVPVSEVLEKTYEDLNVTTPQDRERKFGQKDHVRIYGKDYIQRLIQAGFKVDAYSWVLDQDENMNDKRFCLNQNEKVFFCLKTNSGQN